MLQNLVPGKEPSGTAASCRAETAETTCRPVKARKTCLGGIDPAEEVAMIESSFDARTLANMNVALDRVCRRSPLGEQHNIRQRIAHGIIRCAKKRQDHARDAHRGWESRVGTSRRRGVRCDNGWRPPDAVSTQPLATSRQP